MSSYITEQKKLLLEYLRQHKDKSLTVADIVKGLSENSESASAVPVRSTVYRIMSKLHAEGKVKSFSANGGKETAYQLVEDKKCQSHLHLKCNACGKLYHVGGELSDFLIKQIKANHRFSVDEEATVLFGICGECGRNR